ncbi:hypothetical protein LSH36_454g00003, partial [Paralvinella palmiformis]
GYFYFMGATGEPGSTGAKSFIGLQGATGQRGPLGVPGIMGPPGPPGQLVYDKTAKSSEMRWAPAYEIIGNGTVQNNIEDKYEELAKKDID